MLLRDVSSNFVSFDFGLFWFDFEESFLFLDKKWNKKNISLSVSILTQRTWPFG